MKALYLKWNVAELGWKELKGGASIWWGQDSFAVAIGCDERDL